MMAEKLTVVCTFCLKSSPRDLTKPLLCGHSTCNRCHANCLKTKDGCPKCRKPIPLPRQGKDNEYLDITIDSMEEASKEEGKVRQSKKFDGKCSIHGNVVDFFCHSCDVPACSQCLLTTHKVREHDVASFVDFAKETIKRNIEKLNDLKTLQAKLASDISCSRTVVQKDGGKLKQLVLEAYKDAADKLKKERETLLDSLKKKEQETASLLTSLQDEHDGITSKILSTRKICQSIEKDLSLTSDLKKQLSLGSIDKSISDINHEMENVGKVPIPENLGLSFTAHPRDISFGSLRALPRNEESDYSLLRDVPTWTAEKQVDIGELNIDFSSIVCMSSDWIVHISSLHGSQYVAIRHFSLDKRIAPPRQLMDLATESYNWTTAKDSGHDLSILIGAGQNVYRISFRKKDKEIIQTFKVSFSVEAITWDEYKVDCYLLSNNLRDVHWLSMDGKVTYMCSFQTAPQSARSLTVNDDCKIHLLDPITGNIHVTSYAALDHGEKISLSQHFPKSCKSESGLLSLHSMVTRRDHFVLFHQPSLLTVGKYNNKFCFLRWVVAENTVSEQNLVDISIKDDNLAMLTGTKIAIYKIKSDA